MIVFRNGAEIVYAPIKEYTNHVLYKVTKVIRNKDGNLEHISYEHLYNESFTDSQWLEFTGRHQKRKYSRIELDLMEVLGFVY